MTLEEIRREVDREAQLGKAGEEALRTLLHSDDPYGAVTLVGDLRVEALADDVAELLDSSDPMVRWNAVCALATRIKTPSYVSKLMRVARKEEDEVVRAAALAGLGDLVPVVEDGIRRELGSMLLRVLRDGSELLEMRGAAYEGILSALGVPPANRPSAAKLLNLQKNVDLQRLRDFEEFVEKGKKSLE